MIRIARSFALCATFLGAVTLSGCKQGLNDRCQVTSDCDDDLICVLPVGGTPQGGGVCLTTGGQDMANVQDFSAPTDLAGID